MDDSHNQVVGFVGTGEVTPENAKQLLNDFFPVDTDYLKVWLPDKINRTTPSLMGVWNLMDTWKVSYQRVPASTIVEELAKAATWPAKPTLIALLDDSPETEEIIVAAVKAGIEVKDLCQGLDDIEVEEEPETVREEPNTERTYGEPRSVELVPTGPATITHQLYTQIGVPQKFAEDVHEYGHFEAVIRQIVRDEVRRMGLGDFNGAERPTDLIEGSGVAGEPAEVGPEPTVKAWVNDDGFYKLPDPAAKKAPRGFKTVELSREEAEKVFAELK